MPYRLSRQSPRYALEASLEVETPDGTVEGATRNLSRGGLCAELDRPLEAGTRVLVRLSLVFDVDTASESLSVPARVVWSTPLSSGHQVGLQFLGMDSEQQSYLEMFLRFLDEGRARGAI